MDNNGVKKDEKGKALKPVVQMLSRKESSFVIVTRTEKDGGVDEIIKVRGGVLLRVFHCFCGVF